MDESTRALILLILVLLLLMALAFIGSQFLMKRAINTVIKGFRDRQALTPESAVTADELGYKRKLFQMNGLRDYKPNALQLLMRTNIVQMTEEGKLYLSEEALSQTRLAQKR